ncbi:hypothetical protein GEMRC1_004503 [Eukaryota sp. GEM-RC1]
MLKVTTAVKPQPDESLFNDLLKPLLPVVLEESGEATCAILGSATSNKHSCVFADEDGLVFQLCSYLQPLTTNGKIFATVALFSLPYKGKHVLDLFNSKAKVIEQEGEFEDLIEHDLSDLATVTLLQVSAQAHDFSSNESLVIRFNLGALEDGDCVSGGALSIVLLPSYTASSASVYSSLSLSLLYFKEKLTAPFLNSCLFTKALAPSFDPEGGACTVLVALDNNALDPMLTAVDISSTTSSSQAKKIESELNQRLSVFEDAAHKEQQRLLEEFQKSKTIYENRIKDLKEKVANSQTSNQSAFQEKIAELEAKKEEFNQKKEDFDLKKQEMEAAHNDTKQELRKKTAQLQKTEEELARLKKRLESRNAEIKKKEKKIQKLEKDIKNREAELANHLNSLPAAPDVNEDIVAGLNPDMEGEMNRLKTELMEERKQREDLEFIVMELRSKLDSKSWMDDDDIEALKNKKNKRNPDTMERITREDEEYDTSDYERMNGHESTFDLIEKVLQYLQHGTLLVKHGRAGKPHIRYFYINKDRTRVCWRNVKSEKDDQQDKSDSYIQLADVTRFILGQHTAVFQRQAVINPDDDERSFSLVLKDGTRTLDCVCETEMEHEAWVLGLSALLNVEPRWGQIMDLRPFPESRKLDTGEADLCEKFRILPEEYLRVKDLVLEECYERGYITKADIRIVCRIDMLRATKIHEFMEGRRWICARPMYEDDDGLINPYESDLDDDDGWL